MTAPLAEVQSRIAAIQSRIVELTGGATSTSSATSSSASGSAGTATDFATALTAAQDGTATSAGLGTGSATTGSDVVADARKYLGVPYVFGGTDPATGLDCSGLVQRVFADLGVSMPRLVRDQRKEGTAVASMAQAKPGDLLIFDGYQHIGIYLGNGKMIHAPQPGEKVKIGSVYETPTSIRRIVPSTSSGATAATDAAALVRPAGVAGGTSLSVPFAALFQRAGAKYGVSPALLAAVAKVESGYHPTAVSPAGARGLMQLMPGTAKGLGVNALDPAQAVDGAARLLAKDLKRFGSTELALAAYNAGAGAVSRYGGIPPYAETQAYVPKVVAAMNRIETTGRP
jgi:cell wall-associated NlpC family hydrolase